MRMPAQIACCSMRSNTWIHVGHQLNCLLTVHGHVGHPQKHTSEFKTLHACEQLGCRCSRSSSLRRSVRRQGQAASQQVAAHLKLLGQGRLGALSQELQAAAEREAWQWMARCVLLACLAEDPCERLSGALHAWLAALFAGAWQSRALGCMLGCDLRSHPAHAQSAVHNHNSTSAAGGARRSTGRQCRWGASTPAPCSATSTFRPIPRATLEPNVRRHAR